MKRKWRCLLLFILLPAMFVAIYVRARPSVFNESFWAHAHCIVIAKFELDRYADENDGKFPYHANGFGDALLLLSEDCYPTLTGPGYDAAAFRKAKRNVTHLREDDCGRIYIQGLTRKSNPQIVILFDRLPTTGGDHCHFPHRLWAPLGREVLCVAGSHYFVEECEWPAFAKKQIELLVKEGIQRQEAERLFSLAAGIHK